MDFRSRRRRAFAAAESAGADSLLVTHAADVRWLSGFTGSSGAVALAGGRAVLFTDGRYTTQARAEAAGLRVTIGKGSPGVLAAQWLAEQGRRRCGFDPAVTTVAGLDAFLNSLKSHCTGSERRRFFQPLAGLVSRLREVKDVDEIAAMRRAASLGCDVFNAVLGEVAEIVSEAEFALRLEGAARRGGAESMSFETIVAGGERSALPHGRATTAKLPRRGLLTVDFGVVLDGFCSDMTRTVCFGRATADERAVYHAVLEAQMAGIDAVRAGVVCGAVDEAARSVLRRHRLAKYFSHSTGHGVGLEIHEGPRIAASVTEELKEGMVITIEPGVYIPERFGVRIEDTVVVTATGCDVLTAGSPKTFAEGFRAGR